jgi:hypothetical protein
MGKLEEHWMAAFAKMRHISRMTTGETIFGANHAAEIEQAQQMDITGQPRQRVHPK